MKIDRRQFIKRGAGLAAFGTGATLMQGCPKNNFIRTIETRSSVNGLLDTDLTVCLARNRIGTDTLYSRTYEGSIPGPTLEVQPGDTLRLRITNDLPGDHGKSAMSMIESGKGIDRKSVV